MYSFFQPTRSLLSTRRVTVTRRLQAPRVEWKVGRQIRFSSHSGLISTPLESRKKVTVGTLRSMHRRQEPIVGISAYDFPSGLAAEQAGIDLVVVGDSLAMVALGMEDTSELLLDEMIMHCRAVSRATKSAFTVGDMPLGTYEISPEQALTSAIRLVKEGRVQGVKLEGGLEMAPTIRKITTAGIPVLGHIGLCPQRQHALGGFRVQGKTCKGALRILEDALAIQEAGCFAAIIEAVPAEISAAITERLSIPLIGIGAGAGCSGQVIVQTDMSGNFPEGRFLPKFVKQYGHVWRETMKSIETYRDEVRTRQFPAPEHAYSAPKEEVTAFMGLVGPSLTQAVKKRSPLLVSLGVPSTKTTTQDTEQIPPSQPLESPLPSTPLSAELTIMEKSWDELSDPKRVWVGEPGSHEEGVGRLVLLTPERVASAAKTQIQTGTRVNLGWDMTKLEYACFNRKPCAMEMVPILDGLAFDDIYTINPQQSSQWDGLRHYSMPCESSGERVFYGGTTKAEILDRSNDRIGIHHWAKEGITGRGVLIDYASWAEKRGTKYSTFSLHEIKLSDILQIAEECNITFQRGDILMVRIGLTKEWEQVMDVDAKKAYANSTSPQHAGVEGTMDMLKWIWDTGFAAVAGDALSFEVYPPRQGRPLMHEYMLAGWGMPIGELFDLERLAETCKAHNRWTFFVSSTPFNMPGGISSPPNGQAIF